MNVSAILVTRGDVRMVDRFMAKVELPVDSDGCWIWVGAKASKGYGAFWAGRRSTAGNAVPTGAHRVAYELAVGPIPDGLEIDHLCRTPACVNPDHLEPVTYEENQRRGESPMARQARQTHCKRGHALSEENTYVWKGMRRCRRCNADQQAEIRARRAA